jgi:hypothetical protein
MAIITNWGIHTVSPLFPLDVENEAALGKTDGTNGAYIRGRLDFKALVGTAPINGIYLSSANTLKITTNSIERLAINTATIDASLLTRLTAGTGFGLDTITTGVLYIGETNATDIHIGRTGNKVYIHSDLDVIGTATYIHTSILQVQDKNIEVNLDGTTATAGGAGITVLGDLNAAIASINYDSTLASKWKLGALTQSEVITADDTQTVYNKTVADLSLLKTDENGVGTIHNVNTDNKCLIKLTACSAITGFANGYDGKVIEIINDSVTPVSLKHSDPLSNPPNRIYMESLHEIVLPMDGCLKLIYDAGISGWRPYSSVYYGYIPEWTTQTYYSVGQTIMSVGLGGKRKTFRCTVAHLSGSTIIPDLLSWEIAGGGGNSTIDAIAGENLTKGDAVYICYDLVEGRTIGSAYKLSVQHQYRYRFAGIVEANCVLGDSASIIVSGVVDTISGIASFDMTKKVYAFGTAGLSSQDPDWTSIGGSYRIEIAQPVSPTEAVILHTAPYAVGKMQTLTSSQFMFSIGSAAFADYQRIVFDYVGKVISDADFPGMETGTITFLHDTINSTFDMAINSVGPQHYSFSLAGSTLECSIIDTNPLAQGEFYWKQRNDLSGNIF